MFQEVSVRSQEGFKKDLVAVEEPLAITLIQERAEGCEEHPFAITMRTPGNDYELVMGLLFTEGVVSAASDVQAMACLEGDENVMTVRLLPSVAIDPDLFRRSVTATSACGLCGRVAIDNLLADYPKAVWSLPPLKASLLCQLPSVAQEAQELFRTTACAHSSALFDPHGRLIKLFEDVGRHNAMDKLIGWAAINDQLPLENRIALCSGRLAFELVQKSARAGIPILAAVGAPTSLAVELAERTGITLVGFLRQDRFNVYAHSERISC